MALYRVQSNGKAPTGLQAGDEVVTGGGTYRILGVNADGSYRSALSNQQQTIYNYRGSYYYLTVAKILPVYLDEGGTAVLTPGEKLLLTGTDGQNTFFRTDDGRTGSIRLEYDGEGGWTINGESEENFFEMLPYVG